MIDKNLDPFRLYVSEKNAQNGMFVLSFFASEAGQREKNLVVFGLTESTDEDVKGWVNEMLDAMGEKPSFEA